MKKLALVAALVLTLVSCKQKESSPNPQVDTPAVTKPAVAVSQPANPLCDTLAHLQTETEINDFIKKHYDELCNGTLDECILPIHEIESTKYDSLVKDYWVTRTPLVKTMSWSDVKALVGDRCYPDYIGFKIVNEQITNLTVVNQFSTTETCYSMPLFRAIERLKVLSNTDKFTFTLAKICGKTKVVFSVEKKTGDMYYFDISDNPTKKGDDFINKL